MNESANTLKSNNSAANYFRKKYAGDHGHPGEHRLNVSSFLRSSVGTEAGDAPASPKQDAGAIKLIRETD
jgi:hypothetical protein